MDTLMYIAGAHAAIVIVIAICLMLMKKDIPIGSFAIAAFIPVAGVIIALMTHLLMEAVRSDSGDIFKYNKIQKNASEGSAEIMSVMDLEKGRDVVSVEEALMLNDGKVDRNLIVNTVDEDPFKYIEFLKTVLHYADHSTSHCAASLVMDIKSKLHKSIREANLEYEKNPNDMKLLVKYAELIGKYFDSGLMDDRMKLRYGWEYSGLLSEMIDHGFDTVDIYEKKIRTDFEISNMVEAKRVIMEFKGKFPENESPYLLELKFYFLIRDSEGVESVLSDLEEKDISLSKNNRKIVEYWKR